MKKVYTLFFLIFAVQGLKAQLYWNTNGTGALLTATNWGTVAAGPFTTAWTNGSDINFTTNSAITNVTTIPVGNLTVNNNNTTVTWTAAGTYNTGGGVRTFDIAGGSTLLWNGQNVSTAAGTGFIKNGAGIWNIGAQGNAYPGGFTLNNGIVAIGGNNALGTGALTINGGSITTSTAGARIPGVTGTITVGGDFQLGDLFSVPAGTGNITFTNAVSLGAAATRKIIIGSFANYSFNGVMSGAGTSVIIDNSAGGTISYGAVNTYSGGTTIQGGGILRMGLANALPASGSLTLNGGNLITGATTGFTQSTGTLNLALGGSLVLGTGTHSISFLNSSAVSWSAAASLTILGWTGGYNGTSGTAGKIFVGTDATGLTAGQLAKITFRDASNNPFPAVILSTGEVVPGASVTVPDILLSSPNPAVAAGNISQGANNNVIYRFDLAVTSTSATLNGVTVNTAGTYTTTDISNFKCWYSADNVFNSATDVLLSTLTPVATAGTQVFPSFTSQLIGINTTGYIFITADVLCAAALNNVSVNAIATGDISFVSGNKTGTAFAGDVQTIIAATPNNITVPAASVANNSSSLSWVNPTGCYNEILIVARATAANDGVPTGNGSAYTANANYGSGTALGSGFVVYKGTTSPQGVNGLTNGTPYFYKFFTRFGTTWSAGIEINQTPAAITSPTDYFRSVASGAWNSNATWESSVDSASWIPATSFPGLLASHVVIQNADSVWLDISRSTPNLSVISTAKMNAVTFTMTITSRFNLLNTAAYYQGGTVTAVPGFGLQQVLSTTSNYHFNGTQAGTANTAYPAFGNLYWEPTASGSGTFQNSVSTAPFNLGLVVRGNMTLNIQGGTPREIRFATGASVTRSHLIDGDLNIISSSTIAVITNGGLPVRSIVTVGGNINISAGILRGTSTTPANDGSASLNLSGNINNTGGIIQTGNSTTGIFSLNYVGTGAQSISNTGGTITFTANQLDSINKASGALTLNTPITHAGTIRFITGVVNTGAINLLTLTASASVLGASNASFVNGPVSKIGNTAFTFPVGKTNCGPSGTVKGYVALSISAPALATDQFTAEYIHSRPPSTISNPGIDHVSACDYWKLDKISAAPATINITLNWDDPLNNCTTASPYINDLATLIIAHYNGTSWDNFGGLGMTTGSTTTGTITWTGVTTFSPFSIASSTFKNPLPITIDYFTGTRSNGNHLLNWKVTCVSVPSATIEMERSTDGRNYSSIYSIFATALRCQQPFNYTDNQPAKGINYYRLKMTDTDGKVTYSTVVPLINATKGIDVMTIAPNPVVNSTFNLQISSADKTQMELVITDMQGRIVRRQSVNLIAGFNTIPMNVKNLAAGTYQLCGYAADEKTKVLRFVIQ